MWRMAGVSYLQYVNQSAVVLRSALKEPVKSTVQARSNVEFAGFKWTDGERGERGKSSNEMADWLKCSEGLMGTFWVPL